MASKAIGFLNFKFAADLSSFDRAMKKAQKKLNKFGKSMQKTGKSMTMGLTLPLVALGAASVKAFDEQQKAIAQVEAGLKSTAGTVGYTSEQLQKMAADLQKTTLFGDEEILKGATAQLLTFTNITGEQFKKTQKITLDLATRLDGDLKSSAIMLGKALNDPVANLSALSRAGIQFSTEQKSTIKSLVETNQLAEAQTIILAELEKQYGGSAEAAAAAGMGPIKQLQNELSDLSEQIGARLLPYIQSFVTWIKTLAERFDNLSSGTKDTIVSIGVMLAVLGPMLVMIGKMAIGLKVVIPLFSALTKAMKANPYLLAAAAIIGVAVALDKYITATSGAISVKEELNNIERQAAASIAPQLSSIRRLVSVYDSENTTLKDKERALKELKKLYPKYYGQIDETTYSSGKLKQSTDQLTASLMQKAKLVAYSEGIEKITASIIDLEIKGSTTAKTSIEKFLGHANKAGDMWRSWSTKVDEGNLKEQKQLLKLYTTEFEELSKVMGTDVVPQVERVTHKIDDLGEETTDAAAKAEKLVKPIEAITLAAEEMNLSEPIKAPDYDKIFPTGKVNKFAGALGILGDEMAIFFGTNIEEMEAGLESMISTLSGNLAEGAESFAEYGENIKGILRDIIGALISKGVASAVSGALEKIGAFGPFGVTMIPIVAGLAAGLARTAFNSLIPQFAEGGLVTGPTTALVGEGIGTSMANPEVIAPLDKLKSMIGGGNQHITVSGKLIGNDIFLSNSKTGFNRQRTV